MTKAVRVSTSWEPRYAGIMTGETSSGSHGGWYAPGRRPCGIIGKPEPLTCLVGESAIKRLGAWITLKGQTMTRSDRELLEHIAELVNDQHEDLQTICWRTGCLFAWLVLVIIIGILAVLVNV